MYRADRQATREHVVYKCTRHTQAWWSQLSACAAQAVFSILFLCLPSSLLLHSKKQKQKQKKQLISNFVLISSKIIIHEAR